LRVFYQNCAKTDLVYPTYWLVWYSSIKLGRPDPRRHLIIRKLQEALSDDIQTARYSLRLSPSAWRIIRFLRQAHPHSKSTTNDNLVIVMVRNGIKIQNKVMTLEHLDLLIYNRVRYLRILHEVTLGDFWTLGILKYPGCLCSSN